MSPSISEQLEPIIKSLSKFLWRFHVMLYSIIVIGGVAISIFLVSGLLAIPTEEPQIASISFDKETMKAIKDFRPSTSANDSFSLPAGRSNPFAE